jgi:hypothetical protein
MFGLTTKKALREIEDALHEKTTQYAEAVTQLHNARLQRRFADEELAKTRDDLSYAQAQLKRVTSDLFGGLRPFTPPAVRVEMGEAYNPSFNMTTLHVAVKTLAMTYAIRDTAELRGLRFMVDDIAQKLTQTWLMEVRGDIATQLVTLLNNACNSSAGR